jgi:hypothetical protein
MNDIVSALTIYDNTLIAGGDFTTAGAVAAERIAAWSAEAGWTPLGSGIAGNLWPAVNALMVYDNKLIAGGSFTTAGGKVSAYLAAWDSKDCVAILEEETEPAVPTDYVLSQNYPNPFNATTVIEFQTQSPGSVELTIFNILGQQVYEQQMDSQTPGRCIFHWDGRAQDGRGLPSGIYFYRAVADGWTDTKKMVLLK